MAVAVPKGDGKLTNLPGVYTGTGSMAVAVPKGDGMLYNKQ